MSKPWWDTWDVGNLPSMVYGSTDPVKSTPSKKPAAPKSSGSNIINATGRALTPAETAQAQAMQASAAKNMPLFQGSAAGKAGTAMASAVPDYGGATANGTNGGYTGLGLLLGKNYAVSDKATGARNSTRIVKDPVTGQEKVVSGSGMYTEGDNVTAWQSLTTDQRAQLKQQLYWAGMYLPSDNVLIHGGTLTRSDLDALERAMDLANLNGGVSFQDAINPLAQQGQAQGKPYYGQKGDGSDNNAMTAAELAQQAAQFDTDISQFAYRNGIRVSDSWKQNTFKSIMSGQTSADEVKQTMRNKTIASAYPSLAEQIKAGQDVMDLADPYIQTKAQLLETDANTIDLWDPQVRAALQSRDATSGKASTMPLYDFEKQVRLDPRWQYTNNAKQTVSGMALNVLQSFGFQGR